MKHGFDTMIWDTLINNFAILLGTDVLTAGTIASFIMITSILLSTWILTRGTQSNSKYWIIGSYFLSVGIFTYPVQWMPVWVGLLSIGIPICVYIANVATDRISGRGG
jgi:hypothetical protein